VRLWEAGRDRLPQAVGRRAVLPEAQARRATSPTPVLMEWRVQVRDALGRERDIVVSIRDGRVTVEPPPPTGGFSMTSDQTDLLVLALTAASNRVTRSV